MLFAKILVLHSLLIVVFTIVVKYESICVIVHSAELAEAKFAAFSGRTSILVLFERDHVVTCSLKKLLAVQNEYLAALGFLKTQIEARLKLVHARLIARDAELELADSRWYGLHDCGLPVSAEQQLIQERNVHAGVELG